MQTSHYNSPLPSGIGYREAHRAALRMLRPAVGFLEVHAENVMGGGKRRADLFELRRDQHLSIHGVGLSLGSVERPDEDHLKRLAQVVDQIEPMLVSEHLSFSRVGEDYLNDLLPLPMTPLALRVMCRNVDIVQERFGRKILIENPSRYLSYRSSSIPEPEFLNELARRTGCGLLLDLNNVHVTCANVGGDAFDWVDALRLSSVGEIHLAGYTRVDAGGQSLLIDDHGSAVSDSVWKLFDHTIKSLATTPVLVEWDSHLPDLEVLVAEAKKADQRRARIRAARPRVPVRGGRLAYAS
jgi:uncharacterized protein (UPF0276 family)